MRYHRLRIAGATWFFTVVTHRRQVVLCQKEILSILSNVLREERQRHPFSVPAMVVLPDHLHCLWTLPEGESDFPLRWRRIKAETARRVAADGGPRPLWQARYWEHLIRDETDFARHVDYIHFNPVKHGLARHPADWPHSSFARWVARGAYPADWGSTPPDLPPQVGSE
jgi:putative transposase